MRTLIQILGWIDHCERELPERGTSIPAWLCTRAAFEEAVADGHIEVKGEKALVPRLGLRGVQYGLTVKGRAELSAALAASEDSADIAAVPIKP